jgi:ATP-dependent exoDNAse (exonuclease V) alpha subunit
MSVKRSSLISRMQHHLGLTPGAQQQVAMELLADFCLHYQPFEVFMLSGYAGTGKTSLVASLVKTLPEFRMRVVLLAPTGRAAKVLSTYSGRKAYTIHKHIYMPRTKSGRVEFVMKENKSVRTLFIVDEASMISDEPISGGMIANNSLLEDLLLYVSEGTECQLMLVGDTAQLPPVGQELSPALDLKHLEGRYGLNVKRIELTEVMRQSDTSSVLENATRIREAIRMGSAEMPKLLATGDTIRLTQKYEVMDAMNEALGSRDAEEAVVIVRSNKRANLFNRDIRSRVQFKESELEAGDHLMVVRNNYFWLPETSEAGFIANGDVAVVQRIQRVSERFGCRFAEARIQLLDYPDEPPFEVVLLLDALEVESASLPWERVQELYNNILKTFEDQGVSRSKAMRMMKEDPYFNALQVKYAYAITCHKAQGGQWRYVILEQAWLPDGTVDIAYLRWLYTAFTRTSNKLFLLGFPEDWFEEGS